MRRVRTFTRLAPILDEGKQLFLCRTRGEAVAARSSRVAISRSTYWAADAPALQHSVLLIPKEGRDDLARETIAPVAPIRSTALRTTRLTLRRPPQDAGGTLQAIGFQDLRGPRVSAQARPPQCAYTSFDALGLTAALAADERELDKAKDQLGDQYEFVDDFRVSIPRSVEPTDVAANRSRTALDRREWPEESGVPTAHAAGIRGAGVLVGVLDTGVDADHEEFQQQRIPYRYVPHLPQWGARDCRGFDTDGHGTHVCGILTGRSVGVVPEAQLYVASVIESETIDTSFRRVLYGLDWLLRQFARPENERSPAVLNLSLGFPATRPGVAGATWEQRLKLLRTILGILAQANVLPIVAIGNDGPNSFGYPGAFDEVLGVGAVDFDGRVAGFSGGGAVPGARTKPDLVGYGVSINSSLERDFEGRSVFKREQGTSMATPYVAGVASLYRSLFPKESVDKIKEVLFDAAQSLPYPGDRVGAGLARFRRSRSGGRNGHAAARANRKTAPKTTPRKRARLARRHE